MQFKITKDTNLNELAKEMGEQIIRGLKDGIREATESKFLESEEPLNIILDVFVNLRTEPIEN